MAGSAYKIVNLLNKEAPSIPTLETLRGLRPMAPHPYFNVLRAQDTVLMGAKRVLFTHHVGGVANFGVADEDPGDTGTQEGAEADTFQEISRGCARLTPGSHLACNVVYFPSGGTQVLDTLTWVDTGNRGTVRLAITWSKGANTSTATWDIELEGQQAADTQDGDIINGFRSKKVPLIWPPELAGDAKEQLKFSEWADLDITLSFAGSPRVVDLCLYEQPIVHVQIHNTTDDQSAHAYQVGGVVPVVPQTARPQTDKVDDATYEEHRFGTSKGMEVAEQQGERLGPHILHVSSWHPGNYDFTDTTHPAITIQSATFVDVFDSTRTSWSAANPGFLCDSVNAQLHRYCDTGIILRGKKAVIPVRICVRAEWTGSAGPGVVRVQSSATEFVDVEFSSSGTLETNEAIGWLEGQVVGDQVTVGNVQIFAHSDDAADTTEFYACDVFLGHEARA